MVRNDKDTLKEAAVTIPCALPFLNPCSAELFGTLLPTCGDVATQIDLMEALVGAACWLAGWHLCSWGSYNGNMPAAHLAQPHKPAHLQGPAMIPSLSAQSQLSHASLSVRSTAAPRRARCERSTAPRSSPSSELRWRRWRHALPRWAGQQVAIQLVLSPAVGATCWRRRACDL